MPGDPRSDFQHRDSSDQAEAADQRPSDPGKTWVPTDREAHHLAETEALPLLPETESGFREAFAPSAQDPSRSDEPEAALELETPPTAFGDYELLELVGRGGMGNVYKARHRQLDRLVALKTLKVGTAGSEKQLERFIREAKAAARLDHPHVVPCYEFGEFAGWHYLTMAFVDGETLEHRIQRGPFPPEDAARLVSTLAQAVAYAHHQGVIHRDVKPSNVLLGHDGRPRLTDFGIAKLVDPQLTPHQLSQLTQVGQILGTPGYMAPEQSAGRRWEVGPRADIYGLGGVLMAALTGQHPGEGDSFDTLTETVPEALQSICYRCLAYLPKNRFETADELADALDDYLKGNSSVSEQPPPNEATATPELQCKPRPRHLTMAVVIALALLLGALVGPGLWSRWVESASSEVPSDAASDAAPSSSPVRATAIGANAAPPTSADSLAIQLEVLVEDQDTDILRPDEAGFLPLKPGGKVMVNAKSNQPAFLYLLRIDSAGRVHREGDGQPLELWKNSLPELLPDAPPLVVSGEPNGPAPLTHETKSYLDVDHSGPPGMMTLVLIAQKQPLSRAELDRAMAAVEARPQPAPHARAVLWFDQGRPRISDQSTWPEDHPVLRTQQELMEQLQHPARTIQAMSLAVPGTGLEQ